jgi:hypothetical protein
MREYEYMIGTGWWCGEQEPPTEGRKYQGSDMIRGAQFHHLWSASIDHWTRPSAVLLIDSASKQKPPITNPKYQVLSLTHNPGHAVAHSGQYSGWTASAIHSIEFALSNNAEYLVYVEQDALLFGEQIVDLCISRMRKPLMFGSGIGTPQPLQQSFFIVRNDGMRPFLAGLHSISKTDRVICPEWKFALASIGAHGKIVESAVSRNFSRRVLSKLFGTLIQSLGYDLLPVGFGRSRPVNFNEDHFYFQHGSLQELTEYIRKLPADLRTTLANRSDDLAALITSHDNRTQSNHDAHKSLAPPMPIELGRT